MRPASVDPRRITAGVVAAAALIAALSLLFRFNTLGGALGGFDNDHFIYLVRTDALLDGAQPLRDFVDAELRGAWPALTYAASAWAQRIGGRTLLSEAYLTVAMLALSNALVFLLALRLSRRWWTALLATAVVVTTMPKLYNYPKVLALCLAAWALHGVVARPSTSRLGLAALVTAGAALFRHDLAIYVAAAVGVGLVVREGVRWRATARHAAVYTAFTAVLLLPSAVWIQVYGGIPQYFRDAAASVAVERDRTNLILPALDRSTWLTLENMEVVSYFAFWAVPLLGGVLVVAGLARGRQTREELATAAGLVAMTTLANASFLRANLAERFGDAAPAVVLLAAWIAGSAATASSPLVRRSVAGAAATLLVVTLGTSVVYSSISRELATSGLSESPRDTVRRFARVRGELARMPPVQWTDAEASGTVRAARYVAECTTPDDRLLTLGPLHEIPVYARRRFAAGQAMFKLSLYTAERFQREALERLQRESVPIAVADAAEFGEFEELYPLVARHLARHYTDAGAILVDGEPRIRVFVARTRRSARLHPELQLPCFA